MLKRTLFLAPDRPGGIFRDLIKISSSQHNTIHFVFLAVSKTLEFLDRKNMGTEKNVHTYNLVP